MTIKPMTPKAWTPTNVLAGLDPSKMEHVLVLYKDNEGYYQSVASCVPIEVVALMAKLLDRRIFADLDGA